MPGRDSGDGNSQKYEMFIVDSTATGCDGKSYCCNSKVENESMESDNESYSPLGVGMSFAACYLLYSYQPGSFQLEVYSSSSKHFIDPELMHGIETRMQR